MVSTTLDDDCTKSRTASDLHVSAECFQWWLAANQIACCYLTMSQRKSITIQIILNVLISWPHVSVSVDIRDGIQIWTIHTCLSHLFKSVLIGFFSYHCSIWLLMLLLLWKQTLTMFCVSFAAVRMNLSLAGSIKFFSVLFRVTSPLVPPT